MTTAADLIKLAMSDIGMRESGETPTDDEYSDCLDTFNDMLDSWSADGIVVPNLTIDTLTIASSASSYTIGSGGDFSTARPLEIVSGLIRREGSDFPLRTMTRTEYNRVADKTVEAMPDRYYYEQSYPLGVIFFDSRPTASDVLEIASYKPLSSVATKDTTLSFPEGYKRMVRFNLGIDIAGMFGRGNNVPQTVIKGASDSMGSVKKRNSIGRIPTLSVDTALLRRYSYNINTE